MAQRAVFYARVSTQEEAQLKALPKQVEECKLAIQEKGWDLVDQYVDEGKSGTKVKGRDEYQRLVDDMELDKYDIIVIKSQDRLQRNTKDWYIFVDKLVTNGKKLYMYLENSFYTTDNALITGIKAILAEEYSRDLSKKLNNSNNRRIERAKAGEKFSAMGTNMLYGYRIENCEYVVDREQAEIVKIVFNKYLELDSVTKVRDWLNANGYRNQKGKPFCADSITRMLKNEHYKGTYVLGRYHHDFERKKVIKTDPSGWVYIDNAHEAIVDTSVWDKVNSRIKDKVVKYSGKDGKKKGVGRNTGKDILSGKMVCSCCGEILWRHCSNGYANWFCSSKMSKGVHKETCADPATTSSVRVRNAYKDLLHSLEAMNIHINREFIKKCMVRDLKALRASLTVVDDTRAKEEELEKLLTKKNRLTEAYMDGIISKADYKVKYEDLEHSIAKIKRSIKPAEESEDIKDIDATLANIDEELDKWIGESSLEEKQVDFLIDHTNKITVHPDKSMAIDLDLIGGWLVLAGNGNIGYREKEKDEGYSGKGLSKEEFLQYVMESMPQPHGRIRHERYGSKSWPGGQFPDSLCGHQH